MSISHRGCEDEGESTTYLERRSVLASIVGQDIQDTDSIDAQSETMRHQHGTHACFSV